MKKPTLLTSLISLCLLASCTVLMPPLMGGLGAGAGAAVAGPGGAIVGGTAGAATAQALFPPEEPPAPPDDVWGILSLIIDKAFWLVLIVGVIWLIAFYSPSPTKLWEKIQRRIRRS